MTSGLEGRKVRELGERRGIPPKTEGKFNLRCSLTLQVLELVSSIAIAFLCIPAVSFHWRNGFGPKSQGIRRKDREWWRNLQPRNWIARLMHVYWSKVNSHCSGPFKFLSEFAGTYTMSIWTGHENWIARSMHVYWGKVNSHVASRSTQKSMLG